MTSLLIERLAAIGFDVPPAFVDTLTPFEIDRLLNNAAITDEIAAAKRCLIARRVAHRAPS